MSFDKKKVTVHFASVFSNKKVGEAFLKFLHTEKNPEPYLFLADVQGLKSLEKDSEKIQNVKKIISKYLLKDSKCEINISEISAKKLLDEFNPQEQEAEKWILEKSPTDLFEAIYYSVHEELRQDSFHRFVRTKFCDEIINKFLDDSSVVSPSITKKFDYKDEDFLCGVVTETDIEFGKLLCEDTFVWELIPTKTHALNAYFCSANYFPDISLKTSSFKCEATLSIPFHKTILAFTADESILEDPNATSIQCLNYLTNEELKKVLKEETSDCKRTILQANCDAKFGFPFNPRKIPQAISIHYDPEKQVLLEIFKPHVNDFSRFSRFEKLEFYSRDNKTKKTLKGMHMFDFTFRRFQKLDENKTNYMEVTISQLGGWCNSDAFSKFIIKERAGHLRKSVAKCSARFKDDVKISDFRDEFLALDENSKPKNMYGKLLMDLDIEKMDKEYAESKKLIEK